MATTTIKRSTASDIVNTIRDNLTVMQEHRIPKATADNFAEIGKAITTDTIVMNSFIPALINKVVFTAIKNKAAYESPFRQFIGERVPLGANIEEVYINPAVDTGYNTDGNLLLKTTKPDGKVCYYGMNRQSRYPASITEPELERAFTSESKFMELINTVISSMYSGDSIDTFILGKNLVAKAIDNNAMDVLSSAIDNPKELAKSIANMSKLFTFPNQIYAGYNRVNNLTNASEETPCTTWCPQAEQALIIRADVETEIDFEFLANLYNMSLAELNQMKVIVDDIPSAKYDVHAVLCDKAAIQIRDAVDKMKDFENGSNLTHNWFYHHWQFMYWSMFANAIAFGAPKTATTTEG